MSSPDPVWAAGKPRIVVLGPTEEKLTERLMAHLSGLFNPRWGFCDGWTPGSGSTDDEIKARLSTADMAVLVSGPSTPFELMEDLRDRRSKLRVVPVAARPFAWSSTPLRDVVWLPRDVSIASYSDEDEALVKVVNEVNVACKALQAKRAIEALPVQHPQDMTSGQLVEAERAFQAGVHPLDLLQVPSWSTPPSFSPDAARGGGSDAEAFVEAVLSAFDRASLTQVLYYGLEVDMASIVAPGGLRAQAFELHRWLSNAGRLDQFVKEAVSRNPGNPSLAKYARERSSQARTKPAWLRSMPPDWSNADFQCFLAALCEAYPNDNDVRIFLNLCGVPTDNVQFTGRARTTWHDAIRCAANQGKMEAVFDRACKEQPSLFWKWCMRPQSADRNAVYDRLSKMSSEQLDSVIFRLDVPRTFLPGRTASTSDLAIAVIRWAEQNGQMQRLLDAETSAQRASRDLTAYALP